MELVIEERNLLQSFFRCTSKTDYDSVPNIHLPLHYKKDLDFYATLKNVAVMIGEQKHKIFKMHAPHTNSKNRELQLLNMASVNQTIRFLLDGAFPDEDISRQLNYIVSGCPVLKSKFLGAAEYAELEASNLDEEGSIYRHAHASTPITKPKRRLWTFEKDELVAVLKPYERLYGFRFIPGMSTKTQYWEKVNLATTAIDGHKRMIRITMGSFVMHAQTNVFYLVHRILTVNMGTAKRLFLIVQEGHYLTIKRNAFAPYPVYTVIASELGANLSLYSVMGIKEIAPKMLHMVRKGENEWWYNEFVTSFL